MPLRAVITITDAPIVQYDSIIIDVSQCIPVCFQWFTFTNDNIVVNDSAAAATWTGDRIRCDTLTLTSNGGAYGYR